MAGKSGTCLYITIATNVISTMPTPDQIAYTMPTGMLLSVSDNR